MWAAQGGVSASGPRACVLPALQRRELTLLWDPGAEPWPGRLPLSLQANELEVAVTRVKQSPGLWLGAESVPLTRNLVPDATIPPRFLAREKDE